MKVSACLLVAVTAVSAITVPPSWPRPPPNARRPLGSPNRPTRPSRNYQTYRPARTTTRPRLLQQTQGDWIPVAPPAAINQHGHYIVHEAITTRPTSHANTNVPFSPVTGSRLHLAPKYHPGSDHLLEDTPDHHLTQGDDIIKTNFHSTVSEHEHPKDIPTRPNYPGEGQWAKHNLKHTPHLTTYRYTTPSSEEDKEQADGYDIFERGQERFRLAQNKFKSPQKEYIKQSEEEENKKEPDEFVPEKLYAQVRKTETKKHIPRSHLNRHEEENADKLREVIKDSKIQTVYSEEGYEDSAYDHAGKEKKAESEEGHIRKAEQAETSGRKSNGRKRGQYSQKQGQNRGRTKHRRTKNQNELANTHSYGDMETYQDVKQNVEKELSDSETEETSNAAIQIPSRDKVGSNAQLHTSKHQKIEIKSTMKNGDDINMEIHTEVKFINGSDKRKHKFVKIVPSYQRVVEPEVQLTYDSSENNEGSSEEVSRRRIKRYDRTKLTKIYKRKRPNYYWKRKKTESSRTTHTSPITIRIKSRQKRYTLDYPNIDVPTIKLKNLLKSPKNKPGEVGKYPYLKVNYKVLDENSPLRYAENLDYIPNKSEDEMAFYKSRSKTECTDVPDDIDPIPDKIKNMKSSKDAPENDNDREEHNGPRLEGLGDKIDCLKLKYFGEDPLDSPIFKEDVISFAVPSIFKGNQGKKKDIKGIDAIKKTEKAEDISPDDQFEEIERAPKKSTKRDIKTIAPIVVPDEDLNTTTNPITIQRDAVLKPPYTLQEFADKLMKNKTGPNSIYDQINLLASQKDNVDDESTEEPHFLIVYDNQSADANSIQNDQAIEHRIKNISITNGGYFNPELSDIVTDLSNYSEELPNNEIINLVPENFSEYDLLIPLNTDSAEGDKDGTSDSEDSYLPTQEALRDYRYFSQYATKFKPSMKDTFKINTQPQFSSMIFDISKYLPQIKNHKSVASEVQYKDQINPSEQLNVYSDVLRAINISTQEAQGVASENPQPITVKLQISNNTRARNPKRKIRIKTTTVSPIVDLLTTPEDSTTGTSNNINNIKKGNTSNMGKTSPQIFPTDVPSTPKTLPERIRTMINQYTNPLIIKVPEISQESLEISGLAPPPSSDDTYRTLPIFLPATTKIILKPVTIRQSRQNVNLFYVTGLRPPSKKQLVMNYNDFNKIKRSKRHLSAEQEEDLFTAESNKEESRASRKPIMYTEIVRQRNSAPKPDDTDDEDDEDLLPRKRTYEIRPRTTTTEQAENDAEYFEVEEPAVEKPIRTQQVYEKPTGLPEYIKLIDKLHEYRFANNITTTLPEQETTTANPRATTSTTAKTQTTAESINRGVPAFLQIINALHDTKKQNEPITPPSEEETEEEDDEVPQTPVQNSNPYLSSPLTSTRNEDGEERDTQTHIRNLSNKFRTSIDTSKYKTIERAPIVLRHNLSSRYNAEDEVLPLERIFTTKMPAVFTTTIRNEEKEQREHSPEFRDDPDVSEESEATTVLSTTKATRRRLRPRTRPTTTTPKTPEPTRPAVRRRRPQRVQISTTSTESSILASSSAPKRRIRQRLEPQTSIKTYVSEIPPNHKREYVPVTEIARNGEIKEDFKRPNDINKNHWKKLYERRNLNYQTTGKPEEEEGNDKKEEVEIIGEIKHPNLKHGGNYRHIDDEENEEVLQERPRNRFALRLRPNFTRNTEPTTSKEAIQSIFDEFPDGGVVDQEESPVVHKPKIIKDPSKRMYFYAKL